MLAVCVLAKHSGEAAYVYFPRVLRIFAKEEEFYPEMYVCMYYVWRSTVELTYNAHLECSTYRRIRQAAMSLALFSVYQ